MEKNVGGYDRLARLVVGPVLIVVAVAAIGGVVTIASGTTGAVIVALALLVGAVLTVTAVTRTCPLNSLLGINTYRAPSGPGAASDDAEPETDRA